MIAESAPPGSFQTPENVPPSAGMPGGRALRESAGARDPSAREVAVPAVALAALGRALRGQAGALTAIHSLHAAGYETGAQVFDAFVRTLPRPIAELQERTFWDSLSRFFEKRGWG